MEATEQVLAGQVVPTQETFVVSAIHILLSVASDVVVLPLSAN